MALFINRGDVRCKIPMIFLTGIATSFFFFPFSFYALPGINTKMMIAVLGVGVLGWKCLVNRRLDISGELLWLIAVSGLFSLIGLLSVDYNRTSDYSYAFYIVSMLVWSGAAYGVVWLIQLTHNTLSYRLLVNYLLAVCVMQCFFALLIDFEPSVKEVINTFVSQQEDLMERIGRLYGIGASVDVAGTRFAAVLAITMVLLCTDEQMPKQKLPLVVYLISFVIVAVVGMMIARTTLLGLIVAFCYFIYATRVFHLNDVKRNSLLLWGWTAMILFVMTLFIVFLYYTDKDIRHLIKFAFEGFFNWYEKGTWSTDSTEHLKTMVVFPEHLKTWLIGDGYFENPYLTDPNYVGEKIEGFYMGTDVGYLRFIFYCGLPGLIVFLLFFLLLTVFNSRKYIHEKHLFLILFILQLMIFGKVSTDIFLIYAYFFCAGVCEKKKTNLIQPDL